MILLYPYFLLLLFLPFVFYFLSKTKESGGAWRKVCDVHLLPFLTVQVGGGADNKLYRYLMSFCWFVTCVCLSGPAIEHKNIPTVSTQSGLVVVMDMSPAADANASAQMSRKLYDLLDYKKDATIGLVLADEKAYVALPMTQDKEIFKNIIPDLKENIMPVAGQNFKAGIDKAAQLLQQSGFEKGQILLLTAGAVNDNDLVKAVQDSAYPISVLGFGPLKEKRPVVLPNGQFWSDSKPFLVGVSELPSKLGNLYRHATYDESDLKSLLREDNLEKIEKANYAMVQYQNVGIYGLLLLLPLVALLFRRGVLLSLLFVFFIQPAYAGLWLREEQEIFRLQTQGIEAFKNKQYENAKNSFERVADKDIESLYNMGNALAYMGKIDEAIKTYDQVLSLNPSHEDALYNKEYLKKQMPPPPSQPQNAGSDQSDSKQEQSQSENNENKSDENNQEQQKEQSSSSEGNQENEEQKQQESSSDAGDSKSENKKDSSFDENSEKEEDEAQQENQQTDSDQKQENQASVDPNGNADEKPQEQGERKISSKEQKQKEWLDKIQPDAGRVLRYRLKRQYQEQK